MKTILFEKIFDNSTVAMLLVDKEGKIQLINRCALDLFEYELEEIMGKDVEILVPKDLQTKHKRYLTEYLRSPISRQMGQGRNLLGVKKSGVTFPIEVGLNPIEARGHVFIMSSIIDISERIKAEEKFRLAIEAAPNGMLMINEKGQIVLINKKVEEMFGYTKDELINEPIEILIPDEFKSVHPSFIKNYIKDPQPRAMGIGRELYARNKNSRLFPVEIGLQPIQSSDGIYVISSIVDISTRRETEKRIQEKSLELEEFAYRTSHDLKTPLISISGLTECLLEDLKTADLDEIQNNTNRIQRISKHLLNLVENILILTKTDDNKKTDEEFDFHAYFQLAQEKFFQLLKDESAIIEANFSHDKTFNTQKILLTQILDNLIVNGIKYRNPENATANVTLKTYNDDHYFYIQVKDNGMGIPADKTTEVFKMFTRFHPTSSTGHGIGLYMVKKFMRKMNGEITFETSSAGTIFYLKFPLL